MIYLSSNHVHRYRLTYVNQLEYREIHHEIGSLLFVEKDCSLEEYNRFKREGLHI